MYPKRTLLAGYAALALIGLVLGLYAGFHRPHLEPVPAVPAPAPAPVPITNRYEINANDNGKTFEYQVTSRFTVFLDEEHYPKSELSCAPSGILGPISNIPAVSPPLYAVRYEGIAPGSCTLKDRDFSVKILVTDQPY